MTSQITVTEGNPVIEYVLQSERLSLLAPDEKSELGSRSRAVEAKFITPLDPVIVTASGDRLPEVPISEAVKLNKLKEEVDSIEPSLTERLLTGGPDGIAGVAIGKEERAQVGAQYDLDRAERREKEASEKDVDTLTDPSASLRTARPLSRTNPLFPPLPLYGPSSLLLRLQCLLFRITSFFLSLAFLGVIVLGALFTSLPRVIENVRMRLTFRDPDAKRPFYQEELRRRAARRAAADTWTQQLQPKQVFSRFTSADEVSSQQAEFSPTEGGPDLLVPEIAYYARRVGLDAEEYKVQTEDGFIIRLWHVYNPKEYVPAPYEQRQHKSPDVFVNESTLGVDDATRRKHPGNPGKKDRYPVLLVHGLLQHVGAYCAIDDDSLAFFLCKSGYDVWLGNNRCGSHPEHALLKSSDPRMWAWNIRQMGVLDLPALISRVLCETGFEKLGLISHSQGTTETFVALAKEQRPDLGKKISVFCALAPAAYAGPLIGKAYFKFMRVLSPGMFRIVFGIHSFIPFMMTMHALLPPRLYGTLGYKVFSFLFNWSDARWERDLRDRMFQFAPVYVSAESMRWWLGKDCFAKHKCILATREEGRLEEEQDEEGNDHDVEKPSHTHEPQRKQHPLHSREVQPGRVTAWYDEQVPPFALWVGGSDGLVDGRKLLRRFERGREPHVKVVHSRVIEEYEHLDVLWAMDSIEKVGKEVRDVIWRTMPDEYKDICRMPRGCES